MFDFCGPESSQPLDSLVNPSLTGLSANGKPADALSAHSEVLNITAGVYCQEAINICSPKPAPEDSLILPETWWAPQSALARRQAGSSTIEFCVSSGDSLIPQPASPVVEEAKELAHGYLRE